MLEDLRPADAVVAVADDVPNEQVDALEDLAVLGLPPQVVLPCVKILDQLHGRSVGVEQVPGLSFAGLEPFHGVEESAGAVFAAADGAGLGFGGVTDLRADEVRDLLLPEAARPDSDRVTPDFEYVHRELGWPSVTRFRVRQGVARLDV